MQGVRTHRGLGILAVGLQADAEQRPCRAAVHDAAAQLAPRARVRALRLVAHRPELRGRVVPGPRVDGAQPARTCPLQF